MLLLRIRQNAHDASACTIEVSKRSEGAVSPIRTYIAEGLLPAADGFYFQHRVILNDVFEAEDVSRFGRYGIIEFSSQRPERLPAIYISGGRQEGSQAAESRLLRLSREDHRHLLFVLRSQDFVSLEVVSAPAELPEAEAARSTLWMRLLQIVGTATIAGSPFYSASSAAAQCSNPSGGQNGSVSGAGYSGINQPTIQNQEGGVGIPSSGSGYTLYGLDLGQTTVSALQNTFNLSPALIKAVSPVVGQVGATAQSTLNNNPSIQAYVSQNAASVQQQIYQKVYPVYFAAAAASFNQLAQSKGLSFTFDSMNVQWQTVVASMYFQGAGPTPGINGKFMNTQFASQIVNQQWSAAMTNLSAFNGPSAAQNTRARANWSYLNNNKCTTGAQ